MQLIPSRKWTQSGIAAHPSRVLQEVQENVDYVCDLRHIAGIGILLQRHGLPQGIQPLARPRQSDPAIASRDHRG